MNTVYLSLGSNIGDKLTYLKSALMLIKDHDQIEVIKCSSYYETSPVGYLLQDNFINQVVEIRTILSPYELLDFCQSIENKLKRERLIRFGPRTIDLDILLYNGLVLNNDKLIIPHPRMKERAFVLIPLFEIKNDLIINNEKLSDLVEKVKQKDDYIKKIPLL